MNINQAQPGAQKQFKRNPISLTELVLRDGHQSLLATRMRTDDMLPIAEKLDKVGYWSMESWGGATFDSCIRFLGEDPWERIRLLSQAMPNTPQQMLLRGQNILGYRHYADDVVYKFVETARKNGVSVFRVFDALNDMRNLKTAVKAVIDNGGHAQGTMCYTVSPVHNQDYWFDLAKQLVDSGIHSLAIKDMSGLLTPYTAYRLIKRIKESMDIRIHVHCHATTGLSTATALKSVEAGADTIDTSISSMSMTYGHSATESLVTILRDSRYDTGLDMDLLQEIADYFREVRKKYAAFEGSLKGVDSRILKAQVPGGMLTNMENQLREQNAEDKLEDVLNEISEVRKDLGYIPLVTPSSQIVGTQAVLNVLSGERYKNITKETQGIIRGEYGRTPTDISQELVDRVGKSDEEYNPSKIGSEFENLSKELQEKAKEQNITLSDNRDEDVLTYALFPEIGLKFLKNRNNPDVFEPVPSAQPQENKQQESAPVKDIQRDTQGTNSGGVYQVTVEGKEYTVRVRAGTNEGIAEGASTQMEQPAEPSQKNKEGTIQVAPLAGNLFKVLVSPGAQVKEGDALFILEAMKMETEIRAIADGKVEEIFIAQGDKVSVGDKLIRLI